MATKTAQPKNSPEVAMPEPSTNTSTNTSSHAPINADPEAANAPDTPSVPDTPADLNGTAKAIAPEQIDDVFKELKNLLSTVEKLQKARQDVGDIKPALIRLLDGDLLEGDELEPLKSGVSSLSKLVKIYGDYQSSLERAQPARDLLDMVLK
ncbi:MAG: hypothetical protein AAFZ80_12205 [Cyanobacteria bacterium P01_A01_bin.105]